MAQCSLGRLPRSLLLATLCVMQHVVADEQHPVTFEQLAAAPALAPLLSPSLSADNRFLAYTVIDNMRTRGSRLETIGFKTGVPWNAIGGDVWYADLASGEQHRVTDGSGNNWAPVWSPDGKQLAFLSDRGAGAGPGPARLWVWERAIGRLRQVNGADVQAMTWTQKIEWTPDGRSVITTVLPDGMTRDQYIEFLYGTGAEGSQHTDKGANVRVYSFDPTGANTAPIATQVNLDAGRLDIVQIDVASGNIRYLVRDPRPLADYALSPDGHALAYARYRGVDRPGSTQYVIDIVVHDMRSGQDRVVAAGVAGISMFRWSPRSDALVYRTNGPHAKDEVYTVSSAGGAPRLVAAGPPSQKAVTDVAPAWDRTGRHVFFVRGGVLWRAATDRIDAAPFFEAEDREIMLVPSRAGRLWSSDDGRTIVVQTRHRRTKRMGFARVDLSSRSGQVWEEDKAYGGYRVDPALSADGRTLAYVAEDASHPAELWIIDADSLRPRQISHLASSWFATQKWGTVRIVEWRHLDGDTLRGAMVYPSEYDPGKRYPLIVVVYGGEDLSNNRFRFGLASSPVDNVQLFAARGYAVLLADTKLRVGTPMVDLMKSVLPGVDRAVELGVADPNRVGITGHSYGGYGALSLVVQSPRFKVAVVRAGQGNLIGSYGQLSPDGTNYGLGWSETGQGRMGGTPWQYRERYVENSPVFYLDRVQTPILLIHGGEDGAVQPFLSDEIFTGLRRLGRTVSYARYEDEGHWPGTWAHANQVDMVERMLAWFDCYLASTACERG